MTLELDETTRRDLDRIAARDKRDPADEGARLLRRALLLTESEPFRTMEAIETVTPTVADAEPISPHTRDAAQKNVAALYALLQTETRPWVVPNVAASATGEVVLEWWSGSRKLTAYLGDTGTFEYVQVWGTDIEREMHDGIADTNATLLSLWDWLYDAR